VSEISSDGQSEKYALRVCTVENRERVGDVTDGGEGCIMHEPRSLIVCLCQDTDRAQRWFGGLSVAAFLVFWQCLVLLFDDALASRAWTTET